MDFRNKKVTVMGLGHFGGGVGAARWLARRGAGVTVTDLADEKILAESLAKLDGFPIAEFHLGGHCEEDFRRADLVVVNPAVRSDNPFLQIARDAGVPIRCELELFLNACPAKTIGVTGSNGKSTTTAMIHAILRQSDIHSVEKCKGAMPTLVVGMTKTDSALHMPTTSVGMAPGQNGRQVGNLSYNTWLGGNLGGSLLENLTEMRPDDWVVLEISSFQLWHFSPQVRMPRIAVITGCTPNHLDWHGTFVEYATAKQKMLHRQSPDDATVLNLFDAEVAPWNRFVQGRLLPPYPSEKLPERLGVPGKHNRLNAALAAAAALAAGCTEEEIQTGLDSFNGLPQRMQHLGNIDGRHYYNDSAATTPESTIAALRTFDVPIWLLAGGRNKGFDFSNLAASIAYYAQGVAFFGSCRSELEKAVFACLPEFPCSTHENLAGAFDWCRGKSRPGEAIVLSPACASTDQFRNFKQRGESFAELVVKIAKEDKRAKTKAE
jgi:UDP-N-acetylmuramoylalanine--D-glutamate ligase